MTNMTPSAEREADVALTSGLGLAYSGFGKRFLDVSLAIIAFIPLLAIMIILVPLIMLDGGNPFYFQERIGRNGKRFRMWKLRSMVPHADAALASYLQQNPEAKAEWNHSQKLRYDPRITRIGRIIRKTSLDELPQLWNVLMGDMSMVGPRPMMPCQRGMYPGTAYYALRPGITGFWQISARNKSGFSERAAFDTDYLHQLSFTTDVKVLLRTVGVVLRGTGY